MDPRVNPLEWSQAALVAEYEQHRDRLADTLKRLQGHTTPQARWARRELAKAHESVRDELRRATAATPEIEAAREAYRQRIAELREHQRAQHAATSADELLRAQAEVTLASRALQPARQRLEDAIDAGTLPSIGGKYLAQGWSRVYYLPTTDTDSYQLWERVARDDGDSPLERRAQSLASWVQEFLARIDWTSHVTHETMPFEIALESLYPEARDAFAERWRRFAAINGIALDPPEAQAAE